MLFSSVTFLYYFLPVVLGLYFIVPKQWKNIVLLVSSMFFYFYGEPVYVILMVASILSGYLHGLWINRARNTRFAIIPVISSAAVHLGLLLYFKYADFFIENVNMVFHAGISPLRLALPIGISFYTFQILSYTVDVYRGNAQVQRNPLNFATYVSLFPQLIAGPIVRYTTVETELNNRTHSIEDTASGIRRFIIGLSKKVLLANTLGELGKIFENANEKTVLFYWIAALAFMLQIYFDFSGYSDMAIGLGRIFGFRFLENFNYPYISRTITEFWRRWHISLGTWFRDYVYIPMGGNRVSRAKWIRNIIAVWLLTGLWHGAQWNFILWGLYFGLFLVAEKYFLKSVLNKLPRIAGHLYVVLFVMLSFVLFNSNTLGESIDSFMGLFGLVDIPAWNAETLYYARSYAGVMLASAFAATPLPSALARKIASCKKGRAVTNLLQHAVLVLLLLVATGYLIDGSFNPFLYFRF
jgi:alginate O-acetyltransferase complex protein AlgI